MGASLSRAPRPAAPDEAAKEPSRDELQPWDSVVSRWAQAAFDAESVEERASLTQEQRIARAQARRVAALRAAEQEIAALERRRAERVEQRCATLLEAHERCQEAQGMLMGAFQCGETRAALDACRKRARYGDDENGALPAKPSTEDGNQSTLFMPPAWVMDAFETYVTTPARQAAEAQERAMEGFLRGVDSSSKPESRR